MVAVKLCYPFDSIERHAKDPSDTACLTIDWDSWCKAQRDYDKSTKADRPFSPGTEINVTEYDVCGMSDPEIDDYLDWYEATWIENEGRKITSRSLPQDLLDMFPISRQDDWETTNAESRSTPPMTASEALPQTARILRNNWVIRGIISEEGGNDDKSPVARLGSYHKQYLHAGELPPHAKTFFEATARLAGLSVSTLVRAVYRLEIAIDQRRSQPSRMDTSKGSMSVGSEVVEDDPLAATHQDLGKTSSTENDDAAAVESTSIPTDEAYTVG